MTFLQALILGIVQGITEFLPISSSGHLVLTPFLLGWNIPEDQKFSFDVLVQMGTLVAVFVYFWKDIRTIVIEFIQGLIKRQPFGTPQSRLGWYLILASIPAGIFGILLKDYVEEAFSSPILTAFFLFGTATLLFMGERLGKRNRTLTETNWKDASLDWRGSNPGALPRCFSIRRHHCRRHDPQPGAQRSGALFLPHVHPHYAGCRFIQCAGPG
jgi:undecaprenyl-diphosphatase